MEYKELVDMIPRVNATNDYEIRSREKSIQYLLTNVASQEKILACVTSGVIYGQDWSMGNGVIAVTPTKMVFVAPTSDLIRSISVQSVDIEKIESITLQKGFILGDMYVKTAGQSIRCSGIGIKANNFCDNVVDNIKKAIEQAKKMKQAQSMQGSISVADELKKFKELLDMGVITQEEFDAKKKQLLGL